MGLVEQSEANNAHLQDGEHIIVRLTYISRYNEDNENGEVTRILAQAQKNNERHGITGALIFNHNYFLQSIEGSRPIINGLLRKLIKDTRHSSLQVVECCDITERQWSQWSMNYLIPSDDNKGLALKYSTGTQFNPYLMSSKQVMMFIDALSALQAQEQQQKALAAKKKSWFSIG